jgi:hemolysin III
MAKDAHARPHLGEEIANSVTHGLALIASIAGLIALVITASRNGTVWHVVSCAIFGASLIALYLSSTLYHSFHPLPRVRRLFRIFDHSAIYFLIAGTYTPFTLISIRGAWGWTLFGIVWALTIFGVLFKTFLLEGYAAVSVGLYILMGWLVIFGVKPLYAAIHLQGFLWVLAGGLFYTVGVIFFAWSRRYSHTVWHLFVMGGSFCHFWAVMFYVIPRTPAQTAVSAIVR